MATVTRTLRYSAPRVVPKIVKSRLLKSRLNTSMTAPPPSADLPPPMPTSQQLYTHFCVSTVPFIGFGFMDNTIMIQAGNAIDCSIGVALGLSTLSAAAIGQIVANGMSVAFGGYVESWARAAGLPTPGFVSSAQRALPVVRRVGLWGNLVGVVVGATLGLVNLLLIDTNRSTNLKLEALTEEQEFAFEVEASNSKRPDATVLTVRGPDVDGLLASMTAALTASGCTLVELHATPRNVNGGSSGNTIEDVFVVRPRGQSRGQIEEGHLDELARKLLAASRDPLSAHSLKTQVEKLKTRNHNLRDRVHRLERKLEDRQITIETATIPSQTQNDKSGSS